MVKSQVKACLPSACINRQLACSVFAVPGRAKRAKQVATHVLIDAENAVWIDGAEMATSGTWAGWNPDMSKPWLLTNGKDCFAGAEVQKALKGFVSLFKDSSIRVTEGRAQAPAAADAAAELQAALGSLLPGDLAFSLSAEDRQKSPQLAKAMVCATFGIAASHMCLGKFELSLMPCLRATYQGSRFTTVVLLPAVLKRLKQDLKEEPSLQQVQDYLFKCTEGQLQELKCEGGAFCATVGPNDLLFLPPGCMVSHKIFAQDVSGFRVGLLDVCMESDLREVAKLGDESGCVAQALSFLTQRLTEAREREANDGAGNADPRAAAAQDEAHQNPPQLVNADDHQPDDKSEGAKAAEAETQASEKQRAEEEAKKKQHEEEMAKAAEKKRLEQIAQEQEAAKVAAAEAEAKAEAEKKRLADEESKRKNKEAEERKAAEEAAQRLAEEKEKQAKKIEPKASAAAAAESSASTGSAPSQPLAAKNAPDMKSQPLAKALAKGAAATKP